MTDSADLRNRFTFHPASEVKGAKHAEIRENCFILADLINMAVPDSREKSLAITHLEETMMWANAALARHEAGKRIEV